TKLMGSYMDSKLIMVLLMNYLAKEWPDVRFVSVNPGAIKTKMTSGSGMPKWLLPIRHLLFKSPAYGANSLYKGAFDQKIVGTGIYVSENKVKPMGYTIKADEIRELLA
ncbi:MAG: hypothetical protein AAGB22_09785, partial [Bacteroidota bacterium]